MPSDYKIATRPLDIGNARAYNAGDRVHKQVIDDHFTGDDFADAFMADTPANAEKIAAENAPSGPSAPTSGDAAVAQPK